MDGRGRLGAWSGTVWQCSLPTLGGGYFVGGPGGVVSTDRQGK